MSVRSQHMVPLCRVMRHFSSGEVFQLLSPTAQKEVVDLLSAAWSFLIEGPQVGHKHKRPPISAAEAETIRRVVVNGMAVALGSLGDGLADKAEELADKVVALLREALRGQAGRPLGDTKASSPDEVDDMDVGQEMDEEGWSDSGADAETAAAFRHSAPAAGSPHCATLISACFKRAASPTCSTPLRFRLLQAVLLSCEGGYSCTGFTGGIDGGVLSALGKTLLGYARQEGASSEKLLAIRCLPYIVQALKQGVRDRAGELLREAIGVCECLCAGVHYEAPREEMVIRSQAARALTRLLQQRGRPSVQDLDAPLRSLMASLEASSASLVTLQALLEVQEAGDLQGADSLLPLLTSNLTSRSHLVRLLSLRLLARMVPLSFVEPADAAENARESPFTGPCLLFSLCVDVEELPLSVATERAFTMTLGKLEVMARSGRMPAPYLEALASHCLGLLNVKMAGVWPAALQTFAQVVATCSQQNQLELAWRPLLSAWNSLSQLPMEEGDKATGGLESQHTDTALEVLVRVDDGSVELVSQHEHESTLELFLGRGVLECGRGEVCPQACTDPLTALSSVLSTLKRSPTLMLRRSKVIVPMFLFFLHREYYAHYRDSPEARDLGLAEVVEKQPPPLIQAPPGRTSAKVLRVKLHGFLEAFASIPSPRQLIQHQLLARIYQAMLSKADTGIAKLALDCLLTYKPAYLIPYKDNLQAMLQDNTIRDELVRFSIRDVQPEHRGELSRILVAILFGRFLSKGIKRKGARDGPAGRCVCLPLFSYQRLRWLTLTLLAGARPL
jgi:hypothetical protein